MLLSISTTHVPATDLGYLLHKNPAKCQSFDLPFGKAHVFYSEANLDCCKAVLLLDIDSVGLVRNDHSNSRQTSPQYVSDRPYVASSYLSVAIARVFSSALNGSCKDRPELPEAAIPLVAEVVSIPCSGGEQTLRDLFEPLGYKVDIVRQPLDDKYPDWGDSKYYKLTLSATKRISELLTHMYVLVPALDAQKHYLIGDSEVEKLIRRGDGWLNLHPHKDLIVRRYLKNRRYLITDALQQLVNGEVGDDDESIEEITETEIAPKLTAHEARLQIVILELRKLAPAKILDLGCGEGKLIALLMKEKFALSILGVDVSYRSLEIARDRLHLDRDETTASRKVTLIHGSLMYRDGRLSNYDAAAIVEVIEHLDAARLSAFERVLFEFARPNHVVITTPNAEYNVLFDRMNTGQLRHSDHRFEWDRKQFQDWCDAQCKRFGYSVETSQIGEIHPEYGGISQLAVFRWTGIAETQS